MELWIKKIESASTLEELESLRVDTLGKKGVLTIEFAKMKDIPADDKKSFAENLNRQKDEITRALDSKKVELEVIA
ncbi:MAG TPA: phenylalanine--tRNA ligase subunit alpha, partial [Aliarcobacter cryaerophilus]|nr:phenylalanine--tRNA ligase subunit alpha [Aliarcobacter cryaerophilus]